MPLSIHDTYSCSRARGSSMLAIATACIAFSTVAAAQAGLEQSLTSDTSMLVVGAKDLKVAGSLSSTSITTAGCPPGKSSLRSGTQHVKSTASLVTTLSPGITVTSVAFSYSYITGYKGPVGAKFTLKVAGSDVYASPLETGYPYSKYGGGWSPENPAIAQGLSIKVAPDANTIEFDFEANDRNLQLLLPITINVTCTGGPCTKELPLLPQFFDSNMVLQRGPDKAALYGTSLTAGETVTVAMTPGDKKWTAKAAPDGSWEIDLDAQPASTGVTLTVSTSGGRSQTLTNVAFGDVFLCSGQSNMAFSANLAFNASAEIADSINYPGIRFFTAANVAASTPQTDIKDMQHSAFPGSPNASIIGPYAEASWAVSAPAAFAPAGGPFFTWPSAVCYFFGRDVYKALGGKVPIGLLASDWGGQPIEPFMSPDALADQTCGGTVKPAEEATPLTEEAAEVAAPSALGEGVREGGSSSIWNGMIAPLTKMRFAGMVWYQGESNAGAGLKYACSFPSMIHDWREKFTAPKLPFYFVILAPCDGRKWCDPFVNLRNSQFSALELPQTAYASAVDLGDQDLDHPDIRSVHPRRKQEVGRRLSLQALKMQYGSKFSSIVSTGPVFASVAARGSDLKITYAAGTAETMHSSGTGDCGAVGDKLCCDESPFQVMAAGKWVRAKYTISGEAVTVHVPAEALIAGAASSTAVRYNWEQWPQCALYNGAGGCDDHTGIAGTPFCWNSTAPCPVV